MTAPTSVIVGHSFVKRYHHWLDSRHIAVPQDICPKLRNLHFLGKSGLFTSQLHEGDIVFQSSKHDIVIVDCGTNDLASGVPITNIVNNVLLFARRCLQDGATVVFITSIIPRGRRINGTQEQFREQAKAYNEHLKRVCVQEDRISFYRHAGFSCRPDDMTALAITHWSHDGIHPSTKRIDPHLKTGMEKYHQSIRTALHRAAQRHKYLK